MDKKKSDNFFKNFGLGLAYTLVFPLIVIASLFYGLYGLILWAINASKGVVRFFKGETFYPVLREDKEVALILKRQHEVIVNGVPPTPAPAPAPVAPTPAPAPNNVYVQNNYYSQEKKVEKETPTSPNNTSPFIEGSANYISSPSSINRVNPSLEAPRPTFEAEPIPSSFPSQSEPRLMEIPSYTPQQKEREDATSINIDSTQGDNPYGTH